MGEWTRTTLGRLGTIFDGPHATPTRRDIGPYFLNIASLDNGRLDLSKSDHVSPKDFTRWTRRVTPREGDLLFSYETRLGDAALMPPGVEACLGRRMALLRPNRDVVDPQFLLYLYLSPQMRLTIDTHAIHGATVDRIPLKTMSSWAVSIPPMTTQRATAEVLGALDDKIAANRRTAEIAGALARALFDEATASAARVSFSSRHTPVLGGTPPRSNTSFWGGSHLWISATDVTGADHGVVIDTKEKISEEAVTKTKAKPLPRGSVILTARGTVGAVARLAEPASFNQSAYGFRPNGLPPALLYFSVLDAAKQAANFVHGSVFDTITMRTFDDLKIPDLDFSFADALETKLSALLAIVEHAVRENVTLAATRDALLPGLMSGKLRVKDAERLAESLA